MNKTRVVLLCPKCKNEMILLTENTYEAYCPSCDFLTYNYMKDCLLGKKKVMV